MKTKTAKPARAKAPKAQEVKKATKEQIIASQKECIITLMVEGHSLRTICSQKDMPALSTVMKWVSEDHEGFAEQYARAREQRAEVMFEEIDDISEEAGRASTAVKVAALRLKADNIKWKLARMAPKKYGDKLQAEHSGTVALLYEGEHAKRMAELAFGKREPTGT